LSRRNIDLAVGIAPLSGGRNRCGYHVEGYSADGEPAAIAQRMRQLGGNPRFFSLDEPLYYGHRFDRSGGRMGCKASIDDVARDVARKVRQLRAVFPEAVIGDGEPFPADGDWLADLEEWFNAYQRETGSSLAFLRLDMAWHQRWQQTLPELTALLRRKNIALQVIYNGNARASSDAAWMTSAVQHFQDFEAITRPAVAAIQFWTERPSRILPETNHTSATWLINRYIEWRDTRR
jgi:hypothetical protein